MTYRGALADFVDDLQVAGRLTFTREEALAALGVSPGALKQAALRLSKHGRLVAPRRGFYVIVPLEHRAAGVPPLTSWLSDFLRFHGARGEPPYNATEVRSGTPCIIGGSREAPPASGATQAALFVADETHVQTRDVRDQHCPQP